MEEKETNIQKNQPTWYSLHAEQIRLIQFLLYHLTKYNKKEMKQTDLPMEKLEGKFVVRFE